MNSFTMKAAAVALLGGALQVAGQLTSCVESANPDFTYEAEPVDGFSMYWTINGEAGTVSFQVVSAAMAWAAIGFPETDIDIAGAEAIVGVPADNSVMEYDLVDQNVSSWVVFDTQDITEVSVAQDDSSTNISFTRPLAPGGDKAEISAEPGDITTFIYAVGSDNTLTDYGPEGSGGFRLDVFCGSGADDIVARTPAPQVTAPPSPMADRSVETEAPTASDMIIDVPGATPTPAPVAAPTSPGTTPVVTPEETEAPTTSEETDGQGDSNGASSVGGVEWAAAAVVATGLAGVLAFLSL